MSRQDEARLGDIVEAIAAIRDHLTRGDLHDGLVYDAVRVRLIEIGEAVKGIDPNLLDGAPDVPWKEIARMRDPRCDNRPHDHQPLRVVGRTGRTRSGAR